MSIEETRQLVMRRSYHYILLLRFINQFCVPFCLAIYIRLNEVNKRNIDKIYKATNN